MAIRDRVWLAKGLLFGAAILVAFGLAEGGLRAVGYRYSPLAIGASNANDHREAHAFHDRHLAYDRDLIWRPVSSQFSPFNPQGFRGAPIDSVKPPGTLRIVAIGDSNTFGWAVDDGVNWPAQLEVALAARRAGTRVINAGVWGYTMYQGRQRFRELLGYAPDMVLVSFGANDAHHVRVPDAGYVRGHDRIAQLSRLTEHFRVAQLAVAAWDRAVTSQTAEGLGPRVPLDDYRVYLWDVIRAAQAHHVVPVLLTRPFVGDSTDPVSWKTHAPAYNAATREIGAAAGVPVVDVYAEFRDRPTLFDDESHFGVEGHRQMAALLAARLTAILDGVAPGETPAPRSRP